MAFNPISAPEVASGKPVSATTATKIRENFDDHEIRLRSIEGGSGIVYEPIIMRVNGPYGDYTIAERTGCLKTTANFELSISGVRLLIDKAGTSSSTTIDLKVKRGTGSYESVFLIPPTVASSAGDDAISAASVLNPSKSTIQAGDIIRLDITSAQTGAPSGFMVRIDFVKV